MHRKVTPAMHLEFVLISPKDIPSIHFVPFSLPFSDFELWLYVLAISMTTRRGGKLTGKSLHDKLEVKNWQAS